MKKIPEEIKRLVDELHGSIIENGYSAEVAEQICTLLRDKGGLNSAPYVSDGMCYPYNKLRITGEVLRASTTKRYGNKSVA